MTGLSQATEHGRHARTGNLHTSVHIEAHDDLGRERLCAYLSPAFSPPRMRGRADGHISYPREEGERRLYPAPAPEIKAA